MQVGMFVRSWQQCTVDAEVAVSAVLAALACRASCTAMPQHSQHCASAAATCWLRQLPHQRMR